MTDIESEFLTAADVAVALGVPKRTLVYRLSRGIMRGTLVAGRLWLVPRAEVEHWRGRGPMKGAGRSVADQPKAPPSDYPNEVDGPNAAAHGPGPGEPNT